MRVSKSSAVTIKLVLIYTCVQILFNDKVKLCFDLLQVPGQLLGHGNVDLAIQYADNRDVLYLRLANQPVVFAYPGMSTLYYKLYAVMLTMVSRNYTCCFICFEIWHILSVELPIST